ncbi:MAG: cyanoexosortase A [Leptolyngbyaceae cyanobacterium HOT.MB2.61]|jgi:cyanoexosortase A|nr:cyanoexosortase A [Leptolyngbyaceae cyanobacterium HOT.MB2.61]
MDSLKRLQEPEFWLLCALTAFAALHLALLSRLDDSELFATSLLFWVAVGSLIWEKRYTLNLESGFVSSLIGVLILGLLLLRCNALPDSTSMLRSLPFVAMLGLGLLASGFSGLLQYWRELIIFGLLALYRVLEVLLQSIDLPLLTAKAAMFMLWYSGFQVQQNGVFLNLPTGRVEVYGACSGIHTILLMLSIAVLFLLMFPVYSDAKKIVCLVVAVLIGFLVNSARVALMAILVAFSNDGAFEYWHSGNGSLIFSMISVGLFGLFCWLAFLRTPPETPETGAPTND